MVVSYFSNASVDSARVVSRQQQATINSAVQQWIASQKGSIGSIKAAYNGNSNKIDLIKPYIASHMYDHFVEFGSSGSSISSEALQISQANISLPDWGANADEPEINLTNN
jgi:hypothetical protein